MRTSKIQLKRIDAVGTERNVEQVDSQTKKTTYALKTPSVVALPFIYGVECIILLAGSPLLTESQHEI